MGDIEGSSSAAQSAQSQGTQTSLVKRVIARLFGGPHDGAQGDLSVNTSVLDKSEIKPDMLNLRHLRVDDVAIPKAEIVAVPDNITRDDLVGQYIGHTAPKTREMLKRAMGGVLFIDEAYYLYRPENERDYGAEAIEILLQVMENNRDDLVVIFAGYKERMDVFYQSNPGLSSRVANHIDFPDYTAEELLAIAQLILAEENYRFSKEALAAFADYIHRRMQLPFFANARSIRNAIDRARMRQANRLFNRMNSTGLTKLDLITIEADDITASRVFSGQVEGLDPSEPITG